MEPNELIDNMVEKSKAEVKPTIPQKPAAPKSKAFTDYKGVEKTPYGHVYNFNGESITDLGAERASMKMPVEKGKYNAAKQVLSRNARGLGNIESQYIDLMNKGWKQEDAEAELAKRGFSKDDIKNAYGEVKYGEKYKDWKGNDNYVNPSKYQISKKKPIDVYKANMFESEDAYKRFIAPKIKADFQDYKDSGMSDDQIRAELKDAYGYDDLIENEFNEWNKKNRTAQNEQIHAGNVRKQKIAAIKEKYKNEPEKLRLINDLLPMMEELFK